MLSRAVFRAVPRTTSRLASYTTRTAFKPAFQSPLRHNTSLIQSASRAAFTTSTRRHDSVSQELAAKLENEIRLEEENASDQHDSDAGVNDFLSKNDFWTLVAPEGQQDVILSRNYDDEIVTVSFSIVDFNGAAGMGMEDEDADDALLDEEEELGTPQSGGANTKGAINKGGTQNANFKVAPEDSIAPADREELKDEEDYESQAPFPANVNVLIQRPGKGALRINTVTDNGQFTIHGVTHLPEASEAASATDLLRNTPETLYTGPPFQQLDEEVQSLLEGYLDARGINAGLAVFIPDYIDVKEQREYLGWLQRVKGFVE